MNNGITVVSGIVNRIPAFYDDRGQAVTASESPYSNTFHGVGNSNRIQAVTSIESPFFNGGHCIGNDCVLAAFYQFVCCSVD